MKQKIKSPVLISLFLSLFMLGGMFLTYTLFSESRASDLSANVLRIRKVNSENRVRKTFKKNLRLAAEGEAEREEQKKLCQIPVIEQPLYQGEFITKEMMIHVPEGEEFSVSMYIKNTGNTTWFGDPSNCYPLIRLGTTREQDRSSSFAYKTDEKDTGWIQSNRIKMVEKRVEPNEIATFQFTSRAPHQIDTYREYFRPVVEGKQWLERPEEMARVDIAVGDTDPRDIDRLKYINKTGVASFILDPDAPREIHIDISDQKMHVKVGEVQVREYTVSTGTFKTPTPLGKAKIVGKQELRISSGYPHYRMPKWQSLAFERHRDKFVGVGLHALPYLANDQGVFWDEALNHIGQRVSHGCIRILPKDAEDLYTITDIGDQVEIIN